MAKQRRDPAANIENAHHALSKLVAEGWLVTKATTEFTYDQLGKHKLCRGARVVVEFEQGS